MSLGIERLARRRSRLVVGLMSGTSADGIDAALVRISGSGEELRFELLAHRTYAYPRSLRGRVFAAFDPAAAGADELCHLNFALGEAFALAVRRIAADAGVDPDRIDLIGSHGQTVWHDPVARGSGFLRTRSTLQLGEPAVIAERTGAVVVADFRTRDVAAGGEGAPLVPYVDHLLFRDERRTRLVQNIGGIGNVTVLPAGGPPATVYAFDTGPGNMVMDGIVQAVSGGRRRYDRDGRGAARGRVLPALLAELMAHPYLTRRPPKSTGRETFGAAFAAALLRRAGELGGGPADAIATATAFTACSIADAYARFVVPRHAADEVILGGGGARNPVLVARLAEEMARRLPHPPRVATHEDFGIPSQAKEALAFAILANETLCGRPGNLPRATGASHPVVLGKIVPGTPGRRGGGGGGGGRRAAGRAGSRGADGGGIGLD